MNDTINVDDNISSSAQSQDNKIAQIKSDFHELRELCTASIDGLVSHSAQPFENLTSQIVSRNTKISKVFLFEHLQKIVKHCVRMCERDVTPPCYDVPLTHDDSNIKLLSTQFSVYMKHAEDSLKSHSDQLSAITTQLSELQGCMDKTKSSPNI